MLQSVLYRPSAYAGRLALVESMYKHEPSGAAVVEDSPLAGESELTINGSAPVSAATFRFVELPLLPLVYNAIQYTPGVETLIGVVSVIILLPLEDAGMVPASNIR